MFSLLITVINAHTSLYYNSYFSVRICEILRNLNPKDRVILPKRTIYIISKSQIK